MYVKLILVHKIIKKNRVDEKVNKEQKKEEALREVNLKIGSTYVLISSSIAILLSLYENKDKIKQSKELDLMTAELNNYDYYAIFSRIIPKFIFLYYAWKHFKPSLKDEFFLDTKEGRGLRNAFIANLLDSSSTGLDVYNILVKDVTFY